MLYFEDVEVGSARTSGEFELTEREVIDFARAWDPQPFHVDPQAAARSPFGGLTASACHVFCIAAKLLSEMEPLAVAPRRGTSWTSSGRRAPATVSA